MAVKSDSIRAEAAQLKQTLEDNIDVNKLKQNLDVSNFEPNAVIRGAQLTLVGAHRALQNPGIFTNDHYKQAAAAVLVGICIRLAVMVPVCAVYHLQQDVKRPGQRLD
jgi:hypothetical protein